MLSNPYRANGLLLTSAGHEHHDVEKASPGNESPLESNDAHEAGPKPQRSYWQTFERTLLRYNFEARGIQRVLPEHRHDLQRLGFVQIAVLWISINLTANNLTLGMLSVCSNLICDDLY